MAPRSARKRKNGEGDAKANGGATPNPTSRRRKREEAAERQEVAVESSGSSSSPELKMMELSAVEEGEEAAEKTQEAMLRLSELDESQLMEPLDDTASNELGESLLSMMEDTQGEDAEINELTLFSLGGAEGEDRGSTQRDGETATQAEPLTGNVQAEGEDAAADEDLDGEASQDDENRQSLIGASASIEEILQQLAEVANNFMTNYRELAAEGDTIQAELNQLDYEQETRCERMLGRLQRAGNSIFSFGQPDDDAAGTQADAGTSQAMTLV